MEEGFGKNEIRREIAAHVAMVEFGGLIFWSTVARVRRVNRRELEFLRVNWTRATHSIEEVDEVGEDSELIYLGVKGIDEDIRLNGDKVSIDMDSLEKSEVYGETNKRRDRRSGRRWQSRGGREIGTGKVLGKMKGGGGREEERIWGKRLLAEQRKEYFFFCDDHFTL